MCCRYWQTAADVDASQPQSIILLKNFLKGESIMKKIAIELFIIAATVLAYVLPVLADGGGC
jgi:hypothetical protein